MKETSRLVANLQSNRRQWLLLILVIYSLLAIAYGFVTPLFETPDEHHHFFTLKVIALSNRLPTTFDNDIEFTGQEAAQPPLYYLIASLISRQFKEDNAFEALWPNPSVQLGDPDSPQNINAFVHGPNEEWPWHGLALEAHLLRLFSALIGLGTLLCIYGATRLLWPAAAERALLATALVAFLPQFAFLHGSITNDVLIVFLCTVTLWQLLRLWYEGISWGGLLLLGVTIGLAILTKMAGLLLLGYGLGFLTITIIRERRNQKPANILRNWFLQAGLVTVVALLVSGWLLWRNWHLYNDITATNQHLLFMGEDRHFTLLEVFGETSGLWASIFAVFGWFNIVPPAWVYLVWNGMALAAVFGVLIEAGRRLRARSAAWANDHWLPVMMRQPSALLDWVGLPGLLLSMWVLIVYAGLVRFMLQVSAGQGRLLFPALLPFALGLVYGLTRYRWRGVLIIAPTLALITTVYSLIFIIAPAYAQPPLLAESDIPTNANRLEVNMGQGLELVAVQVETKEVFPGERIWLTLYWQAETVSDSPAIQDAPMLVLELFGRDNKLIGKYQSYHGGGLYPASFWNAGDLVEDRIAVEVYDEAITPIQARLVVKLVGELTSVDVGTAKVVPLDWPELSDSFLAQIDGIQLTAATISSDSAAPGDSVSVNLAWQVLDPPHRDLTTFVHLGDPTKPPLAQGDGIPLGGDYPTRLWAVGELFSDAYQLAIPADIALGTYPVHIGFYDPTNGLRLPLTIGGERQPNDAYLVGYLVVTR